MQGFEEGEKKIKSYLGELQQFAGDPRVAEYVVNVRRNLLFHSRAFTEQEIAALSAEIAQIAGHHPADAEVRNRARDGLVVALAATANERGLDAVTRYFELRKLLANELAESAGAQEGLWQALYYLQAYQKRYPASFYKLWGDAVSTMPNGPSGSKNIANWIGLALSVTQELVKSDLLAAFAIWLEAIQWSKLPHGDSTIESKLVAVAYRLIQREPDESLKINDAAWDFVCKADLSQDTTDFGKDARMASILAALDMSAAVFQRNRSSLVSRFEKAKALVPIGKDKFRIKLEVLDAEPELKGAVDEIDQSMAAYLSVAERWLGDDLVWLPEWPRFVNQVNETTNQVFWRKSALAQFQKGIIELSQVARQRGALAAWNELTFSEGLPPWIDRPLIPIEWVDLHDQNELRKTLSPLVLPNSILHGKRFSVERARTTKPACYEDLSIVETQIRLESGTHGILSFATLPFTQVVRLDATSGPIHELNEHYLKDMDKPAVVLDYLMLFTHEVWGSGPFRIVRHIDEIPFLEPPGEELAKKITELLISDPQAVPDLDGDWRVTANVQYEDSLFRTTFEIKRNGVVAMLTDEPLLSELKVRALKMVDGIRVPETAPGALP